LGSGRTNQIRVHLWQMGYPVLGDPAYLANQEKGDTQTLTPSDPPLQLHAWKLKFTHPLTGAAVEFVAERPAWALGMMQVE
jgi:23S rRNA-/tRNA-specific pseudouridylate synthase